MSKLNPQPSTLHPHDLTTNTNLNDLSPALDLTIRFSASLPDLPLSLALSQYPTTATLKRRIRSSLPADLKEKRIRLIHAGKALDDAVPLVTSLRHVVSRAKSRLNTPGVGSPYDSGFETDEGAAGAKGKGKGKEKLPSGTGLSAGTARVYIHCSIGDVTLSAEDLAAEVALASPPKDVSQEAATQAPLSKDASQQVESTTASTGTTTDPAPRGFDRLLTSGFTPSEISSLRLQFLSIQAHTHTPDTMPSPSTLRALEDQWLDNSNSSSSQPLLSSSADGGSTGATGTWGDDESVRGAIEDMLYGTTMGFFWPVGALVWGVREVGILTPRRKIAVGVGVVLNVALGFVRWGG